MKNLKIKIKKPNRPATVLVMSRTYEQSRLAFNEFLSEHFSEDCYAYHSTLKFHNSDMTVYFCHETRLESIRGLEFDTVVWNASGLMSDTLSQVYSRIRPQYDVEVEY